jgi:hypothetical protein
MPVLSPNTRRRESHDRRQLAANIDKPPKVRIDECMAAFSAMEEE